MVRDPRADTWAPLNWGRHCQPPVLPSCASSGEHTHTLTHTHTHTHSYTLTRTPLSFLFPDVLGFHIYGGKTFLIELPFPEGLWNPTPKLISAARSTKSGSVLICGAHSPCRRRAWAGARRRARAAGCSAHLRTCAPAHLAPPGTAAPRAFSAPRAACGLGVGSRGWRFQVCVVVVVVVDFSMI